MFVMKYDNSGNLVLPRPSFTEPKVYQKSETQQIQPSLLRMLVKFSIDNLAHSAEYEE